MEEQASKEVLAFLEQLMKLNRALVEIFKTANVELFTDMNKTIKEMYRIQHGSEDPALKAIDEECKVIYMNFDMIISVLRTTEDGEIDKGAENALNKFLHNINEATVNIAAMFGLI